MKTREFKVAVIPHMTRLFCDLCDVEMIQTDTVLMTMPPLFSAPEQARPFFIRLRSLRDRLAEIYPFVDWYELSMGMSADYTIAIQEGATIIRVGTAIMGPRT